MTMIWPARALTLSGLVVGLYALSSSLALAQPVGQIAQVQTPPQAASAAAPAVAASYNFTATKTANGRIFMAGQMPAEPALRYFAAITKGDTSAVTITPGAPQDFIPIAEAGMRALMLLPEGQLSFASKRWSLSGTVSTQANRAAALAELAKVDQSAFVISLSLEASAQAASPAPTAPAATTTPAVETAPPPVLTTLPEATPAPVPNTVPARTAIVSAPKPPASNVTAVIAACVEPLRAFSNRNAILFKSGAAVIAPESAAPLDELATDLSACPDAIVHVEGHTDADGDATQNLALSVARAEAVVSALIERGIKPARLYAVGFGEANPIADNTTADGKRLNRRIVVTVSPEHY